MSSACTLANHRRHFLANRWQRKGKTFNDIHANTVQEFELCTSRHVDTEYTYIYNYIYNLYYLYIYIEGGYAVAGVGVFAGHMMMKFGTTMLHPSTRILTTFSNTVMCTAAVADAFWLHWTGFKPSRESFKTFQDKAEDISRYFKGSRDL